ncbi:MAG: 16S rRNA (adenine(1518)-N(6)/adenine(1519)-N(6))-dimethyltransferase RsmA [Candidatus Bathyarchaeota archaeon]|nr:16S rRNA (adenine(1518)-N(6)/adenine(1519)-N(6))-dimethyltransferase RsmA [Candidatus Bathyarchaeota archaeon]
MSLLDETKFLLRKYRIFPKKLLGQNFMVENSIFQYTSDYAALNPEDVVLDVGAGLGILTRFLADRCKRVLAVEFDAKLVQALREQLQNAVNVVIIKGDVLKVPIPTFNKVVSIPPYRISSRLLLWLFSKNFDCAVSIFQTEFVNRLVASIDSNDYGWLTVFAYYYAEIELLDAVPRWMFYPQPNVDSVIIRLRPHRLPPFKLINETLFKQMVKSLFTERNRKVRNAVSTFLKGVRGIAAEDAFKMAEALPFRDKRVRELAPEDFGALANALSH